MTWALGRQTQWDGSADEHHEVPNHDSGNINTAFGELGAKVDYWPLPIAKPM
jgi:hypothetical protein